MCHDVGQQIHAEELLVCILTLVDLAIILAAYDAAAQLSCHFGTIVFSRDRVLALGAKQSVEFYALHWSAEGYRSSHIVLTSARDIMDRLFSYFLLLPLTFASLVITLHIGHMADKDALTIANTLVQAFHAYASISRRIVN